MLNVVEKLVSSEYKVCPKHTQVFETKCMFLVPPLLLPLKPARNVGGFGGANQCVVILQNVYHSQGRGPDGNLDTEMVDFRTKCGNLRL